MTRGMYVVGADDAERVLRAIEDHEAHVLVNADTMGDGLYEVPTRVVIAHVMAVVENRSLEDQIVAGEPHRLRSVQKPA